MAALAEVPSLALDLSGLSLPATIRTSVPLTDEELIAFSERNRLYKIERNAAGELEIMSPVGSAGSYLEAVVIAQLALWAEENGGTFFSSGGGFKLPDGSTRSPDAGWMSQASWDALGKAEQDGYAPLCPQFVVEVLSVRDSQPMLKRKMQMWIENGAQLAWLINPYAGTVSIYRPGQREEVLQRPEVVEADAVVPGFRLRMARFWDHTGGQAE